MPLGMIPCPACSKRYEIFEPYGPKPCPLCSGARNKVPFHPLMGWQPNSQVLTHKQALKAATKALYKKLFTKKI